MIETRAARPDAAPVARREIWAWALFDFANSGYTTVVLTTVYSAYFVAVIAADPTTPDSGHATFLWTISIALANLCVLLSAPVVGAIADQRAWKKAFLLGTATLCVTATALLAMAGPGQVALAMFLVTLSAIAFASGENLIAAFLPEIAPPERMGRISGYGWGLGYFGGLLTLGCCLAYINYATAQGQAAHQYVPVTLVVTAAIFALTATPTFLWLRERAVPGERQSILRHVRQGLREVRHTLSHARELPDLFRFLLCLTLFQAGVATVVVVAAIYAQEVMGFDSKKLILLIMVVNLTAAFGALAFGFVQDRLGSVPSLAGALLIWIVAIAITYGAGSEAEVWLAGNLMGLAMGATQSGGRALIGRLTPVARSGEFFGLWGLASRAAAILGPLSYGAVGQVAGGDHRLALLSTLVLFILGLALLLTVKEERGMAAIQASTGAGQA